VHAAANTPNAATPAGGGRPPPLSIVALDDDADFRQYLQDLLESDAGGGHTVRVAATPEECYGLIESSMPDVLLLDMKMGRASGETVLEELRKRWPKLCVIIVTGYPSLDSMRQTFKRDVFDYLAKPFSIDELNRTLVQAAAAHGLGLRPQDRLRQELGRQIRLARTAKAWTLKELSEASGVSVSQLSSIERGSHLPSLESLMAVSEALGQRPSAWFAAAGM
jgi:DNA-binding NtrC family response regulator